MLFNFIIKCNAHICGLKEKIVCHFILEVMNYANIKYIRT